MGRLDGVLERLGGVLKRLGACWVALYFIIAFSASRPRPGAGGGSNLFSEGSRTSIFSRRPFTWLATARSPYPCPRLAKAGSVATADQARAEQARADKDRYIDELLTRSKDNLAMNNADRHERLGTG